mmetsp:Transcript_14745/g.29077  ORF Transcript_14745/g.29077 Transcript_14745/m.29077 type:complete len:156 (-) Transcript_14745:53-520(-)
MPPPHTDRNRPSPGTAATATMVPKFPFPPNLQLLRPKHHQFHLPTPPATATTVSKFSFPLRGRRPDVHLPLPPVRVPEATPELPEAPDVVSKRPRIDDESSPVTPDSCDTVEEVESRAIDDDDEELAALEAAALAAMMRDAEEQEEEPEVDEPTG